jgi:hypothetical protein
MTRDVFKYFKHVRSLQEDKGAEKAAELGYQHQARGVYLDPKTQKRYKNVGDKLEPVIDEPTAEKGGSQQKPDTKSLGQFNKDATGTQPEAQPTALPQIPDGVSDDEFAAAKAKEFTGGRNVTPERKEFLDKVSKTLVAMGNRQAAAEVADEEEPESPEEEPKATEEPPEKKPEDFPTLDDKVNEIQGTEFKNQPGFTDELPSSNEEYLKKIKDNDYGNGVEFVDLKEVVDTDSIGVPLKYFDTLSRALSTKNVKGETDNWTHYGEGLAGGAGQINSQMGELMTLVFASASPEDRKKLSEVIRSQVKSAQERGSVKKDLTITEDWIDASLNNADAIDTYMSLEAPGSKIVGGSWDQPDELQSLGIGKGGEEKGFSTDIVIRDSKGKNHQLSLKKDANVNFLNSGAGQYTKFYLSGAVDDESSPFHETAKEYFSNIDRVNEIFKEIGIEEYDGESLPNIPNQKKLKELGVSDPKSINKELQDLRNSLSEVRSNDDIVPKEYNLGEYNRKESEALDTNFKKLNSEIRNLDLEKLNTPATEIFTEYFNDGNFSDEIKGKFFNNDGTPKIDTKTGNMKFSALGKSDPEEYKRAKSLLSDSNKESKDGEIADKIKKIMKKEGIKDWSGFVDKLESGDLKLSAREKNKIMLNSILATKTDTGENHRKDMKQRERDFTKNSIEAISKDPVMKAGTLKSLRSNFPLKDVSEGSESMIIGDSVFSKSVLDKMFGTTDFNQIKDRLVVEKDSSGNPFLGYSIEIDTDGNGESDNIIPISDISVRADGLGYGQTIKHEMKLRKDFYKRLQSINKEMGKLSEGLIIAVFGKLKTGREIMESLKKSLRDPF